MKFILGNHSFLKLLENVDARKPSSWRQINTYLQDGLIVDESFRPLNPFSYEFLVEKLLYAGWKYGSAPLVMKFANFIQWNEMVTYIYIHQDMVRMCKDLVNWNVIFDNDYWPEEFHYELEEYIEFQSISWAHKSEEFLTRYHQYVDWNEIEWHDRSEDFIEQHIDHVNWADVSWEDRTPAFLEKHSEHVIWDEVWFDMVPEWFIVKYNANVNQWQWQQIGEMELSEEFLIQFQDKFTIRQLLNQPECPLSIYEQYPEGVNWNDIGSKRLLPEWFIAQFADKLNWTHVSTFQKLSFEMVCRFESKIDFHAISFSKSLTYDVVQKYRLRMQPVQNVKRVIQMEHAKKHLNCIIPRVAINAIFEYL